MCDTTVGRDVVVLHRQNPEAIADRAVEVSVSLDVERFRANGRSAGKAGDRGWDR